MSDFYIPDPQNHYRISLIKSGLRMASATAFIMTPLVPTNVAIVCGGILLFLAEIMGVVEEMV